MISLNINRFVTLLRKMSEHEIILPVVADIIEGQIQEGNIKTDSYSNQNVPYGVYYDMDRNIIYLSPSVIDIVMQDTRTLKFINFLRNQTGLLSDEKYTKGLARSGIGLIIGALLYHGIHIYNRHQRGELIKHPQTKQWYIEFLYRSLYYFSDNLTTMPRQAALLLYYPYLWLIFEKFEIPMTHGVTIHSKTINDILGNFIHFNKTEIEPKLAESGLDQPSLDIYNRWFRAFTNDVKILSYNQTRRAPELCRQDRLHNSCQQGLQNILDISEMSFTSAQAYKDAYDKINTVNVFDYYYPTPVLRELFVTSEPLAKSLFAEYVDGKVKSYQDWQKLSVRGLSFLG